MKLKQSYIFVFLLSIFIFTGCGNGSSNTNNTTKNLSLPMTQIVGLTSVDKGSVTIEWEKLNQNNITYEIYGSINKSFKVDKSNLIGTVKDTDYTTVANLEGDKVYFIKILAKDINGIKSISYAKSIKVSNNKVEVSPNTKYIKTINKVSQDSVIVDSNSTITKNDIIVNKENDGIARKVIDVVDKNGKKILKTRTASLAEIYNDINVHTSLNLIDVKNNNQQKPLQSNQKLLRKNKFALSQQWGSGLTIIDYDKSVNNLTSKVQKNNKIYARTKSKYDNYEKWDLDNFKIKLPKYYAFDLENPESEDLTLIFISDDSEYNICSVAASFETPNSFISTASVVQRGNAVSLNFRKQNNTYKTLKLDRDTPYELNIAVSTAKNCKTDEQKRYTIQKDLYIGTGSLVISDTFKGDPIKFSGYKDKELTIINKLTGSFTPKLIIDSFVEGGKLKNGKVEIVANINLEHEIKAVLEKTKDFKYSKKIINKKFIKVIPAGNIPLIFNGSFEVSLVIEGSATGKIDLTNTLTNNYEFHAGFQYNKDTEKWHYIGSSENTFKIKLKGEAEAEAILRVSLQPKLVLKLYDSVGGGVALDPYVNLDTKGKMERSLSAIYNLDARQGVDSQYFMDNYMSLDKFDSTMGIDLRWYVIASIFDYRLASSPNEGLKEDDISTYNKYEILKTKILSLPKLSIEYGNYLNKIGKDSRLMIIKGKAKPLINPFYTRKWTNLKYIVDHKKWSFAELIEPRQEFLKPLDKSSYLLLVDKVKKDYHIRMTEESSLRLPTVVETTVESADENYNDIPDSWEKAYGIYLQGNVENSGQKDSDADGLSNIEEYKYGTYPNIQDSDADGCTDKEEVDSNTDPLNKNNRPQKCATDGVISLDLGKDKTFKENTNQHIDIAVVDDYNKVKSIVCLSNIPNLNISNTNSKVSFKVPSYSVKKFTITCQAKGDTNDVLAQDTVNINITKENIVTLSLGNNFSIQENKTKVIPISLTDVDNKVKNITCFTTPSISVFSNTNKKVSFTTPSWKSVKAFTVRCQAKDATKVLASSSVDVTVTQKNEPEPEPQNEAPTVTLPFKTLLVNQENTITPTTTDDKGITSYVWSVTWSGKQGTVVSALNSSKLKLNIPNLEPGESGSATVSITVKDEEGLSATATKTYSYSVEKEEALQFVSDNFTDGETLAPSSSKLLEWKIKNVSNVDLKNVIVNLTQEATALTVEEIAPKNITLWKEGETKTFTTTLNVPYNVTKGTHKQIWKFYYDNNKALPYKGKVNPAVIYFEFKTTDPQELVGRLITDKKLIKPNETITSLLEITSGNEPYSIEVNWGDANNENFTNVNKNNTNSMTKSLTHTYANEGSYTIEVKVIDSAKKEATFTDTIKVETNTVTTSWTADVHDIVTDAKESDIAIAVNNSEYRTSWSEPTGSTEYFVKYRLPIPPNLLKLNKKLRVTVRGGYSNISAYDREINFRTSNSMEYTASIRDASFEEKLASDGSKITGGYFTIKNLSTGDIDKTEASKLNTNSVENDGFYSMEIDPKFEVINITKESSHLGLLEKNINLNQQSWLSELDVTFKGNGIVHSVVLEYDKDGNGQYDDNEILVLNTDNKVVDWSLFGDNNSDIGKITHNGFSYGTVISPVTGRVWLDRNLGASRVCNNEEDQKCFGDYYQWGRITDGHEKYDSETNLLKIANIDSPWGWFVLNEYVYDSAGRHISKNDFIEKEISVSERLRYWFGKSSFSHKTYGKTLVCPQGFYVPTKEDFLKELQDTDTKVNKQILRKRAPIGIPSFANFTKFWNALKIPFAGLRDSFTGEIRLRDEEVVGDGRYSRLQTSTAGIDKKEIGVSFSPYATYEKYSLWGMGSLTGIPIRCIQYEKEYKVKKTGQIISYNKYGQTDNSSKDDGYYKKGVIPTYIRDDVKKVVTDKITGLMWQDNEEAKTVTKNWEDAKSYCADLNLGGYSDWRLPDVEELGNIIDYSRVSPSINQTYFKNTESSVYWTSTANKYTGSQAWVVYFSVGDIVYNQGGKTEKDTLNQVRCTRTINSK